MAKFEHIAALTTHLRALEDDDCMKLLDIHAGVDPVEAVDGMSDEGKGHIAAVLRMVGDPGDSSAHTYAEKVEATMSPGAKRVETRDLESMSN